MRMFLIRYERSLVPASVLLPASEEKLRALFDTNKESLDFYINNARTGDIFVGVVEDSPAYAIALGRRFLAHKLPPSVEDCRVVQERSSASMSAAACALIEAEGDIDKACEWLTKMGLL